MSSHSSKQGGKRQTGDNGYRYDPGELPPETRLPHAADAPPAYADKKALKRAVKEHSNILLNLALNKTLHYWKKLIIDDDLLENLPLKALRAAADTRGVSSEGKRHELIQNIEVSVLNEEEAIYLDEIDRIAQAERELEAMGSVYTFGAGDVGQLGLGGSRLKSYDTPQVIPQLRAVGVRKLRAALDNDVFMGVTDQNEVVVWGNGRGTPFFGLKPQEMVDLELLTPRAGVEFDEAVKRKQGEDGLAHGKKKKKKRKKKNNSKFTNTDTILDPLLGNKTQKARVENLMADELDPLEVEAEAEAQMTTKELLDHKRAKVESMALRGIATNRTVGAYGTHEARRLGFRSRAAEPVLIDKFHDECVVDVSIGRTHAVAVTSNGDLYVWGLNGYYQCGLQNATDRRGDPIMDSEEHKEVRIQNGSLRGYIATRAAPHTSFVVDPALNRQFKSDQQVKFASCWADGTAVVLRDGKLLCCGMGGASACQVPPMDYVERTGYGGVLKRPNPMCELFREPRALRTLGVRMVSCGANHCVCVTEQLGAMSWGSGSGGKLGHGDTQDVKEPKRIKTMMNDIVLYVACGIWHSLAVVLVAPLCGDAGWIMTWGSGTKGQLGQGKACMYTEVPRVVRPCFLEDKKDPRLVKWVAVGANHCIALAQDNTMWSWGSNRCGALGRPKGLGKNFPVNGYDPVAGKVEGFSGWGKGMPASIACGPSATVVALLPWDGPDEETWEYEREEAKQARRREREQRKREEEERKEAIRKQREKERSVVLRRLEKYHPLCSICSNVAPYTLCFGFWPDVKRPMQCGSCGHERSQHRAERKPGDLKKWSFEAVVEQERKLKQTIEEAGATNVADAHAGTSKSLALAGQKEQGEVAAQGEDPRKTKKK